MRPLIFSTALPPISMAWSDFIFNKVLSMQQQRQHLAEISQYLQQAVIAKGFSSPSSSHIIPIILVKAKRRLKKHAMYNNKVFMPCQYAHQQCHRIVHACVFH
jgi:8-amino-7-oxononanoate synthase